MNHCPNSTNNTSHLILGKNTYPGDDVESYYVAADDVNKVFQSGKIPLITTEKPANDGKPVIAIVLAQDKAPEREEKDYSIHPDYIRAIKDAGGYPALIAYDEVTAQLNAWEPDGMMLIGGFSIRRKNGMKQCRKRTSTKEAWLI